MLIDRDTNNIPAPFEGRNDAGGVPAKSSSAPPNGAEVGLDVRCYRHLTHYRGGPLLKL
jgi:hypothetical protein